MEEDGYNNNHNVRNGQRTSSIVATDCFGESLC